MGKIRIVIGHQVLVQENAARWVQHPARTRAARCIRPELKKNVYKTHIRRPIPKVPVYGHPLAAAAAENVIARIIQILEKIILEANAQECQAPTLLDAVGSRISRAETAPQNHHAVISPIIAAWVVLLYVMNQNTGGNDGAAAIPKIVQALAGKVG